MPPLRPSLICAARRANAKIAGTHSRVKTTQGLYPIYARFFALLLIVSGTFTAAAWEVAEVPVLTRWARE